VVARDGQSDVRTYCCTMSQFNRDLVQLKCARFAIQEAANYSMFIDPTMLVILAFIARAKTS